MSDKPTIRDDPEFKHSLDAIKQTMGAWMGESSRFFLAWPDQPKVVWPDQPKVDFHAALENVAETLAEQMVVDNKATKVRKAVDRAIDSGALADELPDLLQDDDEVQ